MTPNPHAHDTTTSRRGPSRSRLPPNPPPTATRHTVLATLHACAALNPHSRRSLVAPQRLRRCTKRDRLCLPHAAPMRLQATMSRQHHCRMLWSYSLYDLRLMWPLGELQALDTVQLFHQHVPPPPGNTVLSAHPGHRILPDSAQASPQFQAHERECVCHVVRGSVAPRRSLHCTGALTFLT